MLLYRLARQAGAALVMQKGTGRNETGQTDWLDFDWAKFGLEIQGVRSEIGLN